MMWLVSGAYTGTPESYVVFIHPILSWIFSKLYTLAPNIPWYPLTWFFFVFLSFTSLISIIGRLKVPISQKSLFGLLNLSILLHLLFFLQFTQVAGYMTMAGFGLLIKKEEFEKVKWESYLLILIGFLIRFEAAALVTFGILIWIFCQYPFKNLKGFLPVLFSIILIGAMVFGSKAIYEKASDYNQFLAFNRARSSVIDHPVFYRKVLENEIDPDDPWFYFSRWYFEEGHIDLDALNAEKSNLDSELFTINQFKNTFVRIVLVQKAEAFKSFLSLIVVLLILFGFKKKNVLFLGLWALIFMILNHFYLFYGRVNMLFFLVLVFVLFQNSHVIKKPKFIYAIGLLLVLGLGYHFYNFLDEGNGRRVMKKEMKSFLAELPETEPVFLEGYQEHMFGLNYSASSPVPFINQGWLSRSPFQKKLLKRFGVSSLKELDSFSLLAIRMDEPLVFPDYMKSINPNFQLKSYNTSDNFQFLRFKANKEDL